MRTETSTLIDAMRILANDIHSEDGVANAAIAEAADRLDELQAEVERLRAGVQAEKSVKETIIAQRNRAYEVNDSHLKRIAGLEQERDQLKAQINGMKQAIDDLVRNSEGVAGLHQNGDVAPWDELLTGGRFGEWLAVFDEVQS